MTDGIKILCVEDLPEDAELARRTLQDAGLAVELRRVDTEADFRSALEAFTPELVLCDFSLPGWNGLSALAVIHEVVPRTPVVMFTGTLSDQMAVACLKAGASDYVLKGTPIRLPAAVTAALRVRREADLKAQAEAALRESEQRFRTLVDSAPDAIVSVDADGKVWEWNAAAESVFGYSAAEMVGLSIERVIPEAERLRHERGLSRVEGGDLRRTMTVVARRKDGTDFPAELSLSSVEQQSSVSFIAVIRDRTAALEAQHALEELSRQHELFLRSAGEGILVLSPNASIELANPAALALLAQKASAVMGENVVSFLHCPDGADTTSKASILSSLQSGTPFRGELDFRRSDGGTFPATVALTPLKEGVGISGGLLIFADITEQRRQEEALQASEASYRNFVNNAPYGIYRSTAEGRFVAVNPALVAMLGYASPDELLNLDLTSLYRDPDVREHLRHQIAEGGPTFQFETTWVRKDGSPLKVRLTGRVTRAPEGASDVYEVLAEDLTERTALENQLRQAQKMETVGQLTGGIAHDFNNVLAVILLNTELALATLKHGGSVDPADLQTIQDAGRRATNITRKLLGFSRRADLQREPTHLDRVVASLSGMLRTVLPESIALDIDAHQDLAPVLVDGGSIEQIILNLVTNSRDALPDGGRVTVTVEEVDLDGEECRLRPGLDPGRHVRLSVADNGTGMDEQTLSRVFDPFFTTKAAGAGTGLGMAMVYGMTKQQGGFVEMESETGRGTVTRLYFPVCRADGDAVRDDVRPASSPQRTGTVLLVEDEDSLRAVATRALEENGFDVRPVANGADALDLYAKEGRSIDLVLSDLVLPGITGLDLMKTIHERHGPVPFVLTSGYTGETPMEDSVDLQVPFLRKPWTVPDLLAVVREVLSDEPSQTPPNANQPLDE